MCHSIGEFILKLHAQGLGHEAVIEIMIALLGVMVALLGLIAGIVALAIAVVGWFGYTTIRDESLKRATAISTEVALATATKVAKDSVEQIWSQIQASGVSEGQSEADPVSVIDIPSAQSKERDPSRKRKKATSDRNLEERSGE